MTTRHLFGSPLHNAVRLKACIRQLAARVQMSGAIRAARRAPRNSAKCGAGNGDVCCDARLVSFTSAITRRGAWPSEGHAAQAELGRRRPIGPPRAVHAARLDSHEFLEVL
jgi:hypothetical protein